MLRDSRPLGIATVFDDIHILQYPLRRAFSGDSDHGSGDLVRGGDVPWKGATQNRKEPSRGCIEDPVGYGLRALSMGGANEARPKHIGASEREAHE